MRALSRYCAEKGLGPKDFLMKKESNLLSMRKMKADEDNGGVNISTPFFVTYSSSLNLNTLSFLFIIIGS